MSDHLLNRRGFMIAAGSLTGTALLASCGTPGASTAADNGAKKIDKVVFLTNSDDLGSAKVVKAWNSGHSDNQVQLRQTDSSTYAANFPRLATASDAPNIAGYFIDGGLYTDLARAGSLADLSGFWESSGLSAHVPALIKDKYFGFTPDGKVYGAPTNTSRYGILFYRPSVLKRAGVTPPVDHEYASLADFEAALAKLKAAGIAGISVGGKDGYPLSHIQDGLLASTMAPALIGKPLDIVYTSDAWKQPVEKMVEWAKKGWFADGYLGRSTDQGNTLFGQGKAGFNTGMNVWVPLMVAAGVPITDLDWVLLPKIGALPPKVSLYAGGGFVIPTAAAGRDQTLEFANYLASPQTALASATSDQVIPARTDVQGLQKALGPLGGSMFQFADQAGRSQFGWDDAAPTDMITYDRTNLQAVMAGTTGIDAFCGQLEKLKSNHH